MLYEFDRGYTAAETTKNIHAVYDEEAVGSSTCYRWFSKFRSEDTNLTDKPRSGRPVDFDEREYIYIYVVPKLHFLPKFNFGNKFCRS